MGVLAFFYFIFLFALAQFIVCGQGFYVKLIYVLISMAAPLIGPLFLAYNYSSHSRGVAVFITLVAHIFAACLLVLPLGWA